MGGRAVPSCSDGAVQEQDETEDRCGSGGEDRFGGAAGAGDGGRLGAALPGTSQSDIRVEEAASEQAACLRRRPYVAGLQVPTAFTHIAPPAPLSTAVSPKCLFSVILLSFFLVFFCSPFFNQQS